MESWTKLIFSFDPGRRKEIKAVCNFEATRKTAANSSNDGLIFPLFVPGHLSDLGVEFDRIECKTKKQSCANSSITALWENFLGLYHMYKAGGWSNFFINLLLSVFLITFFAFSPAFLCFFSPTQVTENGMRQIVLHGASPVSIPSFVGNYFFSEDGNDIWHQLRSLMAKIVVLPFPFLLSVMFVYLVQRRQPGKIEFPSSTLFRPHIILFYCCYCVQAFFASFFNALHEEKPCRVCRCIEPKDIRFCNGKPPQRISHHLRVHPLLLARLWKFYNRKIAKYLKFTFKIFLRIRNISIITSFLRFLVFLVLLCLTPVVAVLLLTAVVLMAAIGIFITSPTIILHRNKIKIGLRNRIARASFRCILCMSSLLSIFGVIFVLMSAFFGVMLAIIGVLTLVFSDESLPYVACAILVLYYLWSSYSSFTNKYQDLALTFHKHYKKSLRIPTEGELPNPVDLRGNSKVNTLKIPKELFDMACEELMPIREGLCVLVLKVTLILCFVFLTFSLILLLDVGATPLTKTLVAFFTGSVPKIATMYFDGDRQKKLEAIEIDENAPQIVEDYLSRTPEPVPEPESFSGNNDEALPVLINHTMS